MRSQQIGGNARPRAGRRGLDARNSCPARRGGRRKKRGTHGQWRKPTYRSWENMITRCHNPRHVSYRYYGAKGIKVCARWRTFVNFLADMGKRRRGTSIDRINPFGNYEPGNCRWATARQQQRNRRADFKHDQRNDHIALLEATWARQEQAWLQRQP